MTSGDEASIQLQTVLRETDGDRVTLPVTLVEWLHELAQDAFALAVTYDAHALDTVARYDAGPEEQT